MWQTVDLILNLAKFALFNELTHFLFIFLLLEMEPEHLYTKNTSSQELQLPSQPSHFINKICQQNILEIRTINEILSAKGYLNIR